MEPPSSSTISLILSALLGVALVLFMAPSVIRMNRGYVLRNVALWLGIVLALALLYRTLGPGASHAPSEAVSVTSQETAPDEQGINLPPLLSSESAPPSSSSSSAPKASALDAPPVSSSAPASDDDSSYTPPDD